MSLYRQMNCRECLYLFQCNLIISVPQAWAQAWTGTWAKAQAWTGTWAQAKAQAWCLPGLDWGLDWSLVWGLD